MKKIIKKILRFFNYFIVTSLVVFGLINAKSIGELVLFLLLLGVELYYVASYLQKYKKETKRRRFILVLLQRYSLIVSWLFLIVMVVAVRRVNDMLLLIAVLPLAFEMTLIFVQDLLTSKKKPEIKEEAEEGKVVEGEYQMDKRKLLKLFAGTSAGLLLLYLFNPKKANAAFFGSMPGPGTIAIKDSLGAVVDPAIKNPTDGYGVSDADEVGTTHYYGFVHYNNTDWYILKESSTYGYTYASKVNNSAVVYTDAWTGRATTVVFGTYSDAF